MSGMDYDNDNHVVGRWHIILESYWEATRLNKTLTLSGLWVVTSFLGGPG